LTKAQIEFSRTLAAQIAERAPSVRKGERTRDLLKLTTVRLLDKTSYNDLRLSDVTDEAGLSKGTLYLYFQDKADLTSAVLQDFMSFLLENLTGTHRRTGSFAAIMETNRLFLKLARANKGLFRCIFQISEQEPKFNAIRQKFGQDWYAIVARGFSKRLEGAHRDNSVTILASYCLGLMMDEIVRRSIVVEDLDFNKYISETTPTDDDLAEFLSLIWYRTIYGDNPETLTSNAALTLGSFQLKGHQ
jgi:TetR/AcrR family transcriptional regulator, transcriptional repressor for nem operon